MTANQIFKIIIASTMLISTFCLVSCGKNANTVTYNITDSVSSINIKVNTADVIIIPSDSDYRVEATERKKITYKSSVVNGELKIEVVDTRAWYEKFLSFGKDKVKIYLPEADYGTLKIENDTGDVEISNFNFGNTEIILHTGDVKIEECSFASMSIGNHTGEVNIDETKVNGYLNISNNTGDVEIDGATCDRLKIKVDTGSISLDNVIAADKFDITADTGNIEFDSCDASEVYMETDTGNIKGSFLTDKVIFAETSTGRVSVPKLTTGGRCEITTSTGNIKITIED